jgi:hypothetical protein
LVSKIHYVWNDSLVLNLGGERRLESIDEWNFDRIARRTDAPQQFVLDIVKETLTAALKQLKSLALKLPIRGTCAATASSRTITSLASGK